MLGVGWEACQGSQAGLCQVLGPHHHGHRLEGVVTEPQLPDYAPVVTVVITRAKVLAVQVGLKAAEKIMYIPRLKGTTSSMSPVEPPPPSIGRGAGAACWSLVIILVHSGELEAIVGGETV